MTLRHRRRASLGRWAPISAHGHASVVRVLWGLAQWSTRNTWGPRTPRCDEMGAVGHPAPTMEWQQLRRSLDHDAEGTCEACLTQDTGSPDGNGPPQERHNGGCGRSGDADCRQGRWAALGSWLPPRGPACRKRELHGDHIDCAPPRDHRMGQFVQHRRDHEQAKRATEDFEVGDPRRNPAGEHSESCCDDHGERGAYAKLDSRPFVTLGLAVLLVLETAGGVRPSALGHVGEASPLGEARLPRYDRYEWSLTGRRRTGDLARADREAHAREARDDGCLLTRATVAQIVN